MTSHTQTPHQLNQTLAGKSALEILQSATELFHPRLAFASSFGAEDVVVIDLLAQITPAVRVFTLDTGRLHEETYDVMEAIRRKYGLVIDTVFPDRAKVESLENSKGFYSFRESIENRKECCAIRKLEPLRRALQGSDAWITGLRREQSVTRTGLDVVQADEGNPGKLKFNPLADWSQAQVWEHIRANDVPYNKLHDLNFPSIGCSPCTRAVALGEDLRAGRWWWELPEQKECGLHSAKPQPAASV